jgi:secreted protein with Ig-like and vWFA domain
VSSAAGGVAVTSSARASFSLDIQFYGVPLGGAQDIVFVLDRSGSMDDGKLDDAKQQLLGVIDQLPDGTRVGLVFFNSSIREWTYASLVGAQTSDMVATNSKAVKWLVGATAAQATRASGNDRRLVGLSPTYRDHAHRFIRGINPSGSTAAVPALRSAGTMGARHIVFLSDGLANTGGDGGDLLALAQSFAQSGIRVDTVGLGGDQDYSVLQQMSAMTGGVAIVH